MSAGKRHDVFRAGGGETGALLRSTDWAATPMGPAEQWPQSLRMAISTMLLSKAQIALGWGEVLTFLYNDAYAPILGVKHPQAFARPISEAWDELWDDGLSELLLGVMGSGESLWASDRPFFMHRSGYVEETYFDISYDPLLDADGGVGGVFAIVNETTRRVVGERRLRTLRDLGQVAKPGDEPAALHAACARVLADCAADLPFALVYDLDRADGCLHLRAQSGLAPGDPAAPRLLRPGSDPVWPLVEAMTVLRGTALGAGGAIVAGPWPEPVEEAVVAPLAAPGAAVQGVLVAGVSPRRRLDDEYRDFVGLVAAGIGTALANAEHAAAERERAGLLSELFAQTPVPMAVMKGPSLVFDLYNAAFEDILAGRSLQGRTFREALPELDAQGYTRLLEDVLASGEAHVAQEDRIELRTDGVLEPRYFTYVFAPLRDVADHVEGVIIIGVEVTEQVLARQRVEALAAELTVELNERKRAQAALEQSEERLGRALAAADLGVWELDLATGDIWRSLQNDRIFGYDTLLPRWTLGMALEHVLPEDREDVEACIASARDRGGDWDLEFRIRRVDGEVRWLWMQAATITDGGRKATSMKGVLRDVTPRKQAEEKQQEEARLKDEFLATLSHELRNPLAPLSNALHLLRQPGSSEETRERVQAIMERQVEHLVRLVDDLLDLSRITRGTIELRREHVDVAAIVRNAVDAVEPLFSTTRHTLTVDAADEPLYVDGDPVRLAQVLSNLLNNAAKYSDEGGAVRVTTRRSAEQVEISIRDDGRGLEPADIPRLFEMFTRGSGRDASIQGGLGIGLALARRLTEMHGGTLTAESAGPGSGSTFRVCLPCADSAAEPVRVAESAGATLGGRRFLVVDDNRDAAESLGLVLDALDASVEVRTSGADALAAFEATPADVVLLDVGMPGMDGYEVARRLRAMDTRRDVLIVALTGWGQAADRRRAAEAGFDHHLTKPLDLDALRRILDAPRARAAGQR